MRTVLPLSAALLLIAVGCGESEVPKGPPPTPSPFSVFKGAKDKPLQELQQRLSQFTKPVSEDAVRRVIDQLEASRRDGSPVVVGKGDIALVAAKFALLEGGDQVPEQVGLTDEERGMLLRHRSRWMAATGR